MLLSMVTFARMLARIWFLLNTSVASRSGRNLPFYVVSTDITSADVRCVDVGCSFVSSTPQLSTRSASTPF